MPTLREAQIDSLANHLVSGLVALGAIKPTREVRELVACVVELMSANFEEEARFEDEAERMAEQQVRLNSSLDVTRLRTMIKQRLADKKGFTL